MERRPTLQDSPEKVKILSQDSQDSSMVLFLVLGTYFYITNIVFNFLSARLSHYRSYLIQSPTHASEWRPEVTTVFVR
jgi:threonine/homoserine/homoserine lactone efflux protein